VPVCRDSLYCDVLVTVLHDMQLTHTDLKPENILFVSSDSELEYDTKAVPHFFTLTDCFVPTTRRKEKALH